MNKDDKVKRAQYVGFIVACSAVVLALFLVQYLD